MTPTNTGTCALSRDRHVGGIANQEAIVSVDVHVTAPHVLSLPLRVRVLSSIPVADTLVCFHLVHFCDRHVVLPKELAKTLPKSRLLTEAEWRGIGVQQSRGWQHYAIHR